MQRKVAEEIAVAPEKTGGAYSAPVRLKNVPLWS